jgi:hypothetical protein
MYADKAEPAGNLSPLHKHPQTAKPPGRVRPLAALPSSPQRYRPRPEAPLGVEPEGLGDFPIRSGKHSAPAHDKRHDVLEWPLCVRRRADSKAASRRLLIQVSNEPPSIQQPWAYLITQGSKNIENRSGPTKIPWTRPYPCVTQNRGVTSVEDVLSKNSRKLRLDPMRRSFHQTCVPGRWKNQSRLSRWPNQKSSSIIPATYQNAAVDP